MDSKKLNELRELVEFLKANGIEQFEMESEDLKVALTFAGAKTTAPATLDPATMAALMGAGRAAAPAPSLAAPAAALAAPQAEADPYAGAHIVKSPIVGTFYTSSGPDADTFVKVGDHVTNGKVICIVEAMKLMNEIECDYDGDIVAVLVKDGQPVEYGQPLFAIK
ncbi:MAG: acetyl-CoA carboxylase biotin carboxyl carrier protein [Bryocella sp.]